MNYSYLKTLGQASEASSKIKGVVDTLNENDFYEALSSALPTWQQDRQRIATGASALIKEGSALAKGDIPEALSQELDVLAAERNRALGRYGPAADLSRVKMRTSETLRLKSEVAPALLGRAQQLLQGQIQLMTPRKMDALAAYGPALETLTGMNHVTKGQRLDHSFRLKQLLLGHDQLNSQSQIANRELDLREMDLRWTKSWNQKYAPDKKRLDTIYDKLLGKDEGSGKASPEAKPPRDSVWGDSGGRIDGFWDKKDEPAADIIENTDTESEE